MPEALSYFQTTVNWLAVMRVCEDLIGRAGNDVSDFNGGADADGAGRPGSATRASTVWMPGWSCGTSTPSSRTKEPIPSVTNSDIMSTRTLMLEIKTVHLGEQGHIMAFEGHHVRQRQPGRELTMSFLFGQPVEALALRSGLKSLFDGGSGPDNVVLTDNRSGGNHVKVARQPPVESGVAAPMVRSLPARP